MVTTQQVDQVKKASELSDLFSLSELKTACKRYIYLQKYYAGRKAIDSDPRVKTLKSEIRASLKLD